MMQILTRQALRAAYETAIQHLHKPAAALGVGATAASSLRGALSRRVAVIEAGGDATYGVPDSVLSAMEGQLDFATGEYHPPAGPEDDLLAAMYARRALVNDLLKVTCSLAAAVRSGTPGGLPPIAGGVAEAMAGATLQAHAVRRITIDTATPMVQRAAVRSLLGAASERVTGLTPQSANHLSQYRLYTRAMLAKADVAGNISNLAWGRALDVLAKHNVALRVIPSGDVAVVDLAKQDRPQGKAVPLVVLYALRTLLSKRAKPFVPQFR